MTESVKITLLLRTNEILKNLIVRGEAASNFEDDEIIFFLIFLWDTTSSLSD